MENTQDVKHPKFVRWALLIGIAVILNVFFNVVVALAYPAPQYDDFCPNAGDIVPTDAATCDAQGGVWKEYSPQPDANIQAILAKGTTVGPSGYCDLYAKCQVPYQAAVDQHALYAFVIMTILAVVALLAGLMPIGSSIVSSGLSYGGVIALIIGSMQYWGNAGNWIRLAISTVGLIALLYIGWKRFRD
jgi:hypothetical protein